MRERIGACHCEKFKNLEDGIWEIKIKTLRIACVWDRKPDVLVGIYFFGKRKKTTGGDTKMGALASFKSRISKNENSLPVKKETIRNIVTGNLCRIMVEEGVTKADLAKKLNVSKPAITNLLSGDRNFTLDKLTEISDSLNRTPVLTFTANVPSKISNARHRGKLAIKELSHCFYCFLPSHLNVCMIWVLSS